MRRKEFSTADFLTKEAILEEGRHLIGVPFKEYDFDGRLRTGKGGCGGVVESYFGIKANNEARPDFPEAGVEMKVVPFIRGKRGLRAKERMVCNIIDYESEINNTFETSSFMQKCRTIFILFYEYKKNVEKGDLFISYEVMYQIPHEDYAIFKQDYEKILNKILNGEAHHISEGDSLYLGACTKGVSSKSMRKQPYSDELAKQRAFCFKNSYMSQLLRNIVSGKDINPKLMPTDAIELSFEDMLIEKIKPYYGWLRDDLINKYKLQSTAKNINEVILSRILGLKGHVSKTDEFIKAGIQLKTIRVQKDNKIKENMSFPVINFIDLMDEEWEESELYEQLTKKFLFVIFKENNNSQYVLERIMFWHMSYEDLKECYRVWQRTKEIVKKGVILKKVNKKTYNNLPKKTESSICHVRPHGKNSDDKTLLPDGRYITKQSFWLNNDYILEKIT